VPIPTPCPFTARRRPPLGGILDFRRCRGEGAPNSRARDRRRWRGRGDAETQGLPRICAAPRPGSRHRICGLLWALYASHVSCTLWAQVLSSFCRGRGASRWNEGTGDTSTGFIKNFAHIQEPGANEQRFLTTYKRVNDEREERIRTTGAQGGCDGRVQWRRACSAKVRARGERSGMRTRVALH
jgi:hypothetical protein